jgi:dTDP-4-dehydrorhamnose 3,5-epimerase|tara:strand:+ start:14320 stop:14733 length:414 start_codon:yes stop_codon:yes gene_type:complete
MDGVILTPLKKISHPNGDIFHAMKAKDESFLGFGEAYFSSINQNKIKGWKKHTKMTLNLITAIGKIHFVIHDNKSFFSVVLSKNNYQRLTIAPGLWVAFKGLSSENIILNISNIEHNPNESINLDLNSFHFEWDKIK